MSMSRLLVVAPLLLATGCKGGEADGSEQLGGGPEKDARLVADVYSWECIAYGDDGAQENYQGVYAQRVSLQFAPDALPVVPLPGVGGCTADLNMFPEDAGAGGQNIPESAYEIEWETDADDGVFTLQAAGFWEDDVFEDNRTCNNIQDVLLGGTRLLNAGVLEGVSTPTPAETPVVEFDGLTVDPGTGAETIVFGDEITASWGEHGWDTVWIQVRRELEGVAFESVTCNVTGLDAFTLDDNVWSQLNGNIDVDENQLYVGFERNNEVITVDGYAVETAIRSMAVAIVRD